MSTRLLLNPTMGAACEALAGATPPGLDAVTFVNSGTEATELALKMAKAAGRHRVLFCEGGFHGKSTGALSVCGREAFRLPFEPLLPSVRLPFGDPVAVLAHGGPDAALIVEPVQCEGGVRIPDRADLAAVADACRATGTMLILDEIQTGLGRLGHWWGAQWADIAADILLVGKALSGGVVPVAAVVSSREAAQPLHRDPLLHSSTFAGSPLAMAAARATLQVMKDEEVPVRVDALGVRLLACIRELTAPYAGRIIADVRGLGGMLALETVEEAHAADLVAVLLDQGVIVSHSLNAQRVVRITPAYLLSPSDEDRLLVALDKSLHQVSARWPADPEVRP
ncbi:MAG: aspartate aminotransferase family protein [Actinobacteria bacterium]|nr:aspartate aminotransferase family protein [Actinomycetota bacterium]